MTGPQISYLQTLCREAEEKFDPSLTKAEASKKIDELQARTGCANPPDARFNFYAYDPPAPANNSDV